jgi:hypothetical protein
MFPTVESVSRGDQATSTEGDNRNGEFGRWQKNQCSADGSSRSTSKSGYSKAFGVDLSPDNVAVATVYFVQGVLGLSRLAVSFYLKDDLQLDPAEVCGGQHLCFLSVVQNFLKSLDVHHIILFLNNAWSYSVELQYDCIQ